LLPSLFELKAGNFYIALAGEPDRRRALKIIHKYLKPNQRIFVGVLAPIDQHIETPEEKSDRSFELGKNCRIGSILRLDEVIERGDCSA
jgi:5-methyltetrahydropteroyltriglutamate--homocysteine methyltransferase